MDPSITPLDCGTLRLDKSILTAGVDRGVEIDTPSISFLIEGEETILVDTSYGDADRMTELHGECKRTPEQTLEGALRTTDVKPEEVNTVILTHLHWDHCYNLDLFKHADIYVQRRELEYAIAPYDLHAVPYESKSIGREPPWLDIDLQPLEGETRLTDNVAVFPTPGHSVGHQSVTVDVDGETVVIAGDAVPTFENLEGTDTAEFIAGYSANSLDWWRSAEEVVSRADRVLPGHEPSILE